MTDVDAFDNVYMLAKWLRSPASKLETSEGVAVQFGKRVHIFYGKHVLPALQGTDFSKISGLKDLEDITEESLTENVNEMLERGYFRRVLPMEVKKKRFDAEHATRVEISQDQSFAADGMYMWIMEEDQKTAGLKAAGVIGLVLIVCFFKIWPIWLRILSWWASLLVLVSLITMIILHLVSGPLFLIIGMRGVYFMPNLFDEEIFFIETFSPLFGRGGEHQLRWKEEREMQLHMKAKKKAIEDGTVLDTPAPSSDFSENVWTSWKMALANALIFVIVGGVVGYYSGIFSPENVPEFVISSKEMYQIFPSLAPPTVEVVPDDVEEIEVE